MRGRVLRVCALSFVTLSACAQDPSIQMQIDAAVLAAPEDSRDGAQVVGYDGSGRLSTLREGTNEMVCLADDPESDGFSVACYHASLEPYMARGRELRAEGVDGPDVRRIRTEEVEAGTLEWPSVPASLFILTGTAYEPISGAVEDEYLRYVVYVPYATSESTGLPERPGGPGAPWLMDAGSHRAHIMISPPRG